MNNVVFVLDTDKRPMTPCSPARARQLMRQGEAAVYRRHPFTLILKEARPDAIVKALTIKIDPGAKTTGFALMDAAHRVLFAAELTHRGRAIKESLDARRALRRDRRNRKTRCRAARFDNRRRPKGWLAPSLQHRVATTMTWVGRFRRWTEIDAIALERVKFDMQKMQNPEISGVEYQQGALAGYQVREYLLEKFNRQCVYCGAKDVPLEIEHVHPKALGGSDRVSNLTLACRPCNEKKGATPVDVFLKGRPAVLAKLKAQLKKPLAAAAAVNATRNALFDALLATGLTVETGDGAQTKFNRTRQGYGKAHWIDAACCGDSGAAITLDPAMQPLRIQATGHGNRQMCGTDKYGFPIRHRQTIKRHFGFETGDLVRAVVPMGKRKGTHVGRLLCRASGSFDISTSNGRAAGISHRYCRILQRLDGYAYA